MKPWVQFLFGSCAVYAIAAACSVASHQASRVGAAGEPAAPGPIVVDPTPDAAAQPDPTTRLKPRYYKGDDGSRQPLAGMWDSQRSQVCTFQMATDGKLRCMPPSGAEPMTTPSDYVAGEEGHD